VARPRTVDPIRGSLVKLGSGFAGGFGRYRRLVRRRDAVLLIGAGVVSEIGDWFNAVALIALSFDLGDGALGVGGMLALRMVPRLVLQAPAGALVDRWPGTRVLVVSHLLMGAIAAGFVVMLTIPELWLLYALVLALEAVNTVAWPAFRVQLANQTPPEQFAAVNGLLSILMTGAQFVGPLLGGLVLVGFGPAPVFLVNGLSFVAVAVVATRLPAGRATEPASPTGDAPTPVQPSPAPDATVAARGYGWLLRRTDLALFAGAALGATVAVRGAIALFVVRSDELGLGEGGPGYFYAAVALGAVVGGALAGGGTHAGPAALRGAALAMVVCALALVGFGAVGGPVPVLIALAVAGLATNVYEVLALTFFQHQLPPGLYGRFMAVFMLALGIGGIVGAIAGPLVQAEVSVAVALAVIAVPGVALALALLLWELMPNRTSNARAKQSSRS
jgi:MFS family permease